MRSKIILVSIFVTIQGFSQVYIGSNTQVYVKNQLLYVKQNIDLASNSNLYLRNNSQLIQGTSGLSTNTGTGVLSVYQEGTSDNFDYNYWCSPIGNTVLSSTNNNFGISLLYQPISATLSNSASLLPLGSYDGLANPLAIASHWVYKLTAANNYSQWVQVGSTLTIAPGEGFTMKGTSGIDNTDPEGTGIVNNPGTGAQRYDFRGKPNDGNITVSVGAGNAATLTGNPYPSALHLNAFLLDPANNAAAGIAYFWQQDKNVNSHFLSAYRGGYAAYAPVSLGSSGIYTAAAYRSYNSDGTVNANPSTGTSAAVARKYLPIGQGFVINGVSNGAVTFKNSHRIFYPDGGSFSKFEKPVKALSTNMKVKDEAVTPVSHFKMNVIVNKEFTRQLALAFIPEATDGVDRGIDAINIDAALPNDVSFWIDNANYVIEGIDFDLSKKIPLSVKAETDATFKFYISEIINLEGLKHVYIYDSMDMSYHDIKNESYEAQVGKGKYTDRFKISFTSQTLGTDDNVKPDFYIIQDNKNQVLKVLNINNVILKSFTLFDINGQIVLSENDLPIDQDYSFSTSDLSSGLYIAALIRADGSRVHQKVIISKSDNRID
ncbi:secretion protein [Flavobacterium sp. Root901]|uniref:T9SS type A sorting domain-containing protein n=1 Tax=Flavobacterium sp. Root901 TaxID=1736605 RepID=UPI00071109A5|nr:T9SS type A sorting domain-containing protein [Flavobacterium sp. Root901]KRD09174.1 secretion protein [Flavobacterium sp. Root901]